MEVKVFHIKLNNFNIPYLDLKNKMHLPLAVTDGESTTRVNDENDKNSGNVQIEDCANLLSQTERGFYFDSIPRK